jgi:hypothetical protein
MSASWNLFLINYISKCIMSRNVILWEFGDNGYVNNSCKFEKDWRNRIPTLLYSFFIKKSFFRYIKIMNPPGNPPI